MNNNLWELEEAQKALYAKEYSLCGRYLEKALEKVRCMYCHRGLDSNKSYHAYFKGYRHDECAEKYHGRIDYERQPGVIICDCVCHIPIGEALPYNSDASISCIHCQVIG